MFLCVVVTQIKVPKITLVHSIVHLVYYSMENNGPVPLESILCKRTLVS